MPQSLSNVLVHLVFSTSHRHPWIVDRVRPELHANLAHLARLKGCECLRAGGVEDHVHMAVRLSRTLTIAQLVEEVKTGTSKWIKTRGEEFKGFAWQRGYGAFSARPSDAAGLLRYIDGQREHHAQLGFQDEFRALLHEHGLEGDERYMWE
jgi:putative transposase